MQNSIDDAEHHEHPPAEQRGRRHLNRVGSSARIPPSEPTTVGQRMVHRRLQLGLTQEKVASQVRTQTGRRLARKHLLHVRDRKIRTGT